MKNSSAFVTGLPCQRAGRRSVAAKCAVSPTEIISVTETNGGAIVWCEVMHKSKKSKHRVLIGDEIVDRLCEGKGKCVEHGTLVQYVMDFFMENNTDLTNTQGLMDVETFPINYFSVRQLFYFWEDSEEILKKKIAEGKKAVA